MVSTPPAIPVTQPETRPTEAMDKLLAVQVPPDIISLKHDVAPTHKLVEPKGIGGFGFTVTGIVVKHPVDNV